MTDELLERIASVLERIETQLVLLNNPSHQHDYTKLPVNPLPSYIDGKCLFCGGYHSGMQCPKTQPMCNTMKG